MNDQFAKLMWTASVFENEAKGSFSLPAQLKGPPSANDLRSLEGRYAEVSRIKQVCLCILFADHVSGIGGHSAITSHVVLY